jgi:hypothetical protein
LVGVEVGTSKELRLLGVIGEQRYEPHGAEAGEKNHACKDHHEKDPTDRERGEERIRQRVEAQNQRSEAPLSHQAVCAEDADQEGRRAKGQYACVEPHDVIRVSIGYAKEKDRDENGYKKAELRVGRDVPEAPPHQEGPKSKCRKTQSDDQIVYERHRETPWLVTWAILQPGRVNPSGPDRLRRVQTPPRGQSR